MKTIEEKADSYIKRGWWKTVEGWVNRVKEGYIQDYKEAMRWRDPKEEMPKDGECVLVKTIYGDLSVAYYWEEKGDFVFWDAPIHDVVGWREIIEL